jgi:hypothetical protein
VNWSTLKGWMSKAPFLSLAGTLYVLSALVTLAFPSGPSGPSRRIENASSDRSRWLVGPYIAPSRPIDVLDGVIDFKASPSDASSRELRDALALFSNETEAIRTLDRHREGGRIYVGFKYSQAGDLLVQCGRTLSWSTDWDEIERQRGELGENWFSEISFGSFNGFKRAGRQERIYAIARCLSLIPQMPPLRAIHPTPREVRIEPAVYRDAVQWLSQSDSIAIRGTVDQYRTAFRCLVTQAARRLRGTGEIVVLRKHEHHQDAYSERVFTSFTHSTVTEHQEINFSSYSLHSVETSEGADWILSRDRGELAGIWPSRAGYPGITINGTTNPFIQLLSPEVIQTHLTDCRRAAGLFEIPPSRIEVGPSPSLSCP